MYLDLNISCKTFIDDGIVERFEETSDVRPYYVQCSVYVLPSYREGTPRTVLEAMAMGRPIITTDTNGCRETVQDCVSGFLVPVRGREKLAKTMEMFVDNPLSLHYMGELSRKYCQDKYEVTLVNREMIKGIMI